MFSIGPPKSASDSETSSRSDSPSKGSEWSTTSEPHVQPKTPQKLKYDSSSDGEWSDQSDTPVKPRTLRRSGRVLLPGLRNSSERFLARDSDEISSLRLSDEGSSLRSSDDGSPRRASDDDSPSKESSEGLVFPFAGSDYDTDVVLQQVQDFPTSEHWVTQWDPKDTDFFNSGQIPVRPFPRIAVHSELNSMRENWGLPPLSLRCPEDYRRHPAHIYRWDTQKLNCTDKHESACQLCGTACCSVQAFTKAIHENPRPNPVVPLKYREAFQRDIDEINALKPRETDPFERMLKCGTCLRNVCPDCAGRCMKPACLSIVCKSCGDPDPWIHCQCEMNQGKVKISYL
ncbi:hypothetical protein D6C99_09029 [Aureobasidium pullulans]|nr:hypothetical protein D6C99_09029 [Aureobasidium pullulans]